jgi:hypothetical protein
MIDLDFIVAVGRCKRAPDVPFGAIPPSAIPWTPGRKPRPHPYEAMPGGGLRPRIEVPSIRGSCQSALEIHPGESYAGACVV